MPPEESHAETAESSDEPSGPLSGDQSETMSGDAGVSPHSSIGFLQKVLDDMIERYGSGAFTESITRARKEYDDRRGRVFEDEEFWETWTQAFLEWYVVERPLGSAADDNQSPAAHYLAALDAGDIVPSGDAARRRAALGAWLTSYRSLFEVRGLRAGRVELVDLLGGGQYAVMEQRAMAGVSPGDVAELRVIGFAGEVVFGRTFCFHPRGTRAAIIEHIRHMAGQSKSRSDIMDFCASLRVRCERYRHVSAERIYRTASHDRGRTAEPAGGRE